MKPLRLLIWACFLAFAPAMQAQIVIDSGSGGSTEASTASGNLPLRNLQIEVRQIEEDNASRERLDASVAARLQPGQSSAAIGINAQGRPSARSGTAQQLVLVLNGHRSAIMLGQAVPLRLLRTVLHNGIWRTVPGTLWLQAGTGYEALPRWDGGDMVELELSASQSRGVAARNGVDSSSTSTTLMLPLGEWMTIGESDQDQDSQQSGPAGLSRSSSQNRLKVQVRVTVR